MQKTEVGPQCSHIMGDPRGVPEPPLPLQQPPALLLHLPQPGQVLVLGAVEELGEPLLAHLQQAPGTLRHGCPETQEGR